MIVMIFLLNFENSKQKVKYRFRYQEIFFLNNWLKDIIVKGQSYTEQLDA